MPKRKDKTEQQSLHPHREQLDAIFQKSYEAIKDRIRSAMRGEAHPTLQTGDLVHDLYLNLLEVQHLSFDDTRKVLNLLSAKARLYLIDRARKRKASKRGGGMLVPLSFAEDVGYSAPVDIIVLNEAIEKLAKESPLAAEIVQLRWFAGLNQKEIAALVGHDRSTVHRYWEFSKLWIMDFLSPQSQGNEAEEFHGR
jgi:RNA polymerase sigma factor (TIGR02999 family)